LPLIVFTFAASCGTQSDRSVESSAILPAGAPSDFWKPSPIGDPAAAREQPQIANVAVVDLNGDALADVLVCDAGRRRLSWIRQSPKGVFTEQVLAEIRAPGHIEPIDHDGDGDLDLLVADLGELFPSNQRIGSVIVLENDGRGRFIRHTAAEGLPRVADVRGGDLDGDGDQDLAVAAFGYDHGQTLWLENRGKWSYAVHVLQELSGAVNALVADLDRNGTLDIVTVVSQEWEEVWMFDNAGGGRFTPRLLWGSSNADFGSSWLATVDLDRDGDVDLLYSNGDAFDYAPANSRPWHGVQWLENQGSHTFALHRIADLSGASSPVAFDADHDGDVDVTVVSAYNAWNDPAALSLVWLENNGRQQFTLHPVASAPTHLITLATGDLDGNGMPDLVTGGMHISAPYDRMSRVTLWTNGGEAK
jgi:FG-GAP-like repeat